jgi:hypothetical protein
MIALVRLWILLSALLVSAGWILSALHQLNRVGYGIIFALAIGAWLLGRPKTKGAAGASWGQTAHKIWWRGRRLLPASFFILVLLSLLAGEMYLPHNGDSGSYRTPRVLHWLGQEQWHWIHTLDIRMNIAGTGFEWLSAPMILFTGSDRGLFLINWVSYLLLPGLIYSVFTRLGVRGTVAWWWMWLLSSGWCFVWQAQDTGNDSFAVIYALASVDFALRARQSHRLTDWWLALLSAALLTGTKQTSIPLVLMSLIAIWPGIRPLLTRPLPTLLVLIVGLLISALPVTIFNLRHTGNWMGTTTTAYGWSNTELASPFWGVIGNTFCLTVQNLKPPIFPLDHAWNGAMQHFVHTSFGSHFKSFENFGYLEQSASAASAGIGLGVCLMLLLALWRARQLKLATPVGPVPPTDGIIRLLWLAPWVALLVFMAKVGTYENARQLAPYYVFLLPIFLIAPGHARVVRERWWRRLAGIVMLVTVMMVVTSRSCPLFPAQTLFGWLHEKHPQSQVLAHVLVSFSSQNDVRIQRNCFQADLLPAEKVIGYYSIANCGAEPGLWLPWGVRRVERILPDDSREYVRSLNIHYVVVDEQALDITRQTIGDWLRGHDGELVSQVVFNLRWGHPPMHLYLVRVIPTS